MIDVQADWSGGIEALVEEANLWLARLLPADRASRPKDEVNPRLVRHYTTSIPASCTFTEVPLGKGFITLGGRIDYR